MSTLLQFLSVPMKKSFNTKRLRKEWLYTGREEFAKSGKRKRATATIEMISAVWIY